jgi:hypothetical protein
LNFTKPSVTNSIISHPLAQGYRYSNSNPTKKAPISKEEILSLI